MRAKVGEQLVVKGHHVGEHDRHGLIVEVHGPDGTPPFLVEWEDVPGHHLVWPGPDATVELVPHISRSQVP